MIKLTKNLSYQEFACKCPHCDDEGVIKPLLAENIQEARDKAATKSGLNLKIYISSGNRCYHANKSEGGSKRSKHLFGLAADFWFYTGSNPYSGRVDMWPIYEYMSEKYKGDFGLAFYKNSAGKTRIHHDVATIRRPWRENYAK